jgi:MYXO-CTERM domain-containing protein
MVTGEAGGTGRVQVGVNGDTVVTLTTPLSATDDADLMPAVIRFGNTITITATDPDATTINGLRTTTRRSRRAQAVDAGRGGEDCGSFDHSLICGPRPPGENEPVAVKVGARSVAVLLGAVLAAVLLAVPPVWADTGTAPWQLTALHVPEAWPLSTGAAAPAPRPASPRTPMITLTHLALTESSSHQPSWGPAAGTLGLTAALSVVLLLVRRRRHP